MIKLPILFFLLLTFSLDLSADSKWKKLEKPFGSLMWNDGIDSAANKLLKMGAAKVYLGMNGDISNDAITSEKSKAEIDKLILSLFKKRYGDRLDTPQESVLLKEYTDASGNTKKLFERSLQVQAEGIVVNGVSCNVAVNFWAEAAITTELTQNLISHPKGFVFAPYINSVHLKANSSNLKEKYGTIRKALSEKYFTNAKDSDWFLDSGDLSLAGIDGLNGKVSESEFSVSYQNVSSIEQLREEYRKKMSDIESSKTAGKKDNTSGL